MGLRESLEASKRAEANHSRVAAPQYQAPKHYQDSDIELDAIERLKSNILMLDDLQQRLRFINNELETVLGTRKK